MFILRIFLFVYVSFSCYLQLNGQAYMNLFAEGGQLISEREFEAAHKLYKELLEYSFTEKETGYKIYALCYVAYCEYEMTDYFSMHDTAKRAYDEFNIWENKDYRVLTSVVYLLGISYYRLGDPSLAFHHLQTSFNLNRENKSLAFRSDDLFYNLALCYLHFADYEKVRLYMNMVLENPQENMNSADLAQWNNLIAKSYQYEKKYDLANKYYQYAIADLDEMKKLTRKDYSLIILNNYISYLLEVRSLDEAESMLTEMESLELNKHNIVNYKQNLANLELKRNNKSRAIQLYDEIIEISIEYYGTKSKDLTETFLDISRAYFNESEFDKTLQYVDQSLESNTRDNALTRQDSNRKYLIPKLGLESLLLKAKAEAKSDYPSSRKTSFDILELIQYVVKHDLSIFESKLHLVQFVRSYIQELIDLALKNDDLEGAYYLCQQSHGLVLDLQIDENAIKREVLSEDILSRDKSFKRDITKLQSEVLYLQNSEAKKSVSDIRSQLFDLQYDYDQFTDSLYKNFPQLNNEFNADDHKIEDLQNHLLTTESALIEYFIENNLLYTFCITRDSIFTHKQLLPDNFDDIVGQYISSLRLFSNENFDLFVNSSSELYSYVLSPVIRSLDTNIHKLHIIPDGILNYISFDALIDTVPESIGNNRYDLLRYVIHSYEIDYNYSSLLYTFENNSINQELTGFAPSFSSDSTFQIEMSPLMHNIDEILQIEEIIDGDMHIDTSAVLANFVKSVNDYNIAHLATHAICNDSIPMKSSIYFQDKVLNTYEIYNMPNSLDLVVLSACNTGTGKLRKGEGIMSLARAFMASGCNSIVTSLWNVNDKTSVALMTDFYKELSGGKSVSNSLRTAKLNYIANPSSILDAHPYYWSGFVLVGDDVSFSGQGIFKYLLLLLIMLSLILFFLFIRSRS